MIIAQISDTHLTLDTPDANQRMRDFALTIADINALDPPPQAIVHTGDIVHNGRREEYAEAASILAAARAPVISSPATKMREPTCARPLLHAVTSCPVLALSIMPLKIFRYG